MGWDQHSSSRADAAPHCSSGGVAALQDSHSYKPEEQPARTQTAVFGLPGPATTDPSCNTKSHERWDPVMTSLLKQASNTHTTSRSPSFPGTFLDSCGPPPGIDQLRGQSTATTCSARTTTPVAAAAAAAQMDSSSTSVQNQTLGAPSSAGAASTRVGKKRSRASRRPPTTVLEADSASFRNMVQQLTGIPAPPPMSSMVTRFDHFLGSGLVRPQAMRHVMAPPMDSAGAPGLSFFHQYQPPYSLRRLESHQQQQQQQQQYRGMSGFNLDPSKVMVNSSTAGQAVMQQGGVYVAQGGNSDAWECEGESLNAGVKREDGRPLPSWSTRL